MSKSKLPAMKPCPFCGSPAEIKPWHGGGPMKRLISCSNEFCSSRPQACESTPRRTIEAWNTRAVESALLKACEAAHAFLAPMRATAPDKLSRIDDELITAIRAAKEEQ